MTILDKCTLLNRNGDPVEKSVLDKPERVALFFSANFCKPCHEFLPLLKDFYEEVNEDGTKKVEVVFVSLDKSQAEQETYHKAHGDWPRISFLNEAERLELKNHLGVEKIPALVILDETKENAKFKDGVNDVRNMGPMAFEMKWGN